MDDETTTLVEKLEALTSQGVISHNDNCQCDHCVQVEAETYLATLIQSKNYYREAPTRPW